MTSFTAFITEGLLEINQQVFIQCLILAQTSTIKDS